MTFAGLLPGALFQMGAINGVAPWYEITGTTRYFPTLYQDERLFLVADQAALLYTPDHAATKLAWCACCVGRGLAGRHARMQE